MTFETKIKLALVLIIVALTGIIIGTFINDRIAKAENITNQFPNEGKLVDPCTLEVVECTEEKPVTIEDYIRQEARKAGINQQLAVDIAKCESQLDPYAKNPNSTAKGIYQWTDGTWEFVKAKGHQFDQYENVDQFMKWFPKNPQWWTECLDKLYTTRSLQAPEIAV